MQKFSAHFANWYSVMESAANVDLDDSEPVHGQTYEPCSSTRGRLKIV